ncbi:unnamed protein product, partial [marine sediment metagenome]
YVIYYTNYHKLVICSRYVIMVGCPEKTIGRFIRGFKKK